MQYRPELSGYRSFTRVTFFFCRVAASSNKVIELTTIPVKIIAWGPVSPLERHGIPYWDLCFMRDKAAVGANLYLEDSPANIEALRSDGHATIAFRNSTNRHLPPPYAEDWIEMEALIFAELEQWEGRDTRRRLAGV